MPAKRALPWSTCRRVLRLLVDFEDGTVTTTQRRLVLAHLADCPSCRREREAAQAAVRLLTERRTPNLSGAAGAQLEAAVRREYWALSATGALRVRTCVPRAAWALAVASAAVALAVVWRGSAPQRPRPPVSRSSQPARVARVRPLTTAQPRADRPEPPQLQPTPERLPVAGRRQRAAVLAVSRQRRAKQGTVSVAMRSPLAASRRRTSQTGRTSPTIPPPPTDHPMLLLTQLSLVVGDAPAGQLLPWAPGASPDQTTGVDGRGDRELVSPSVLAPDPLTTRRLTEEQQRDRLLEQLTSDSLMRTYRQTDSTSTGRAA